MRYDIEKCVIEEAEYILATGKTIREVAKEFKVSKSTIHVDMSERLHMLNFGLYLSVTSILNNNFNERNIRGGAAIKRKYLKS